MDTDTREKMEAYRHVYETGTTAVLSSALFRGIWSAPEDAVALRYPAAKHGDPFARITYGELRQYMERLGRAFYREGFLNGRIAVAMDPSPFSIIAFLTVLCSGNAIAAMDPAQPQDKLLDKLRRIRAFLLIGDISTLQEDFSVWSMERIRQICSGAETGNTGESEKTEKTEKTEDMCWLQSDRKEDDEAYLIFTSGTTGTDKCVVRTQRNTAAVLKEICSAFAYGREQLLILPAYHLYAIEKVITPVLAMGLTLTLSRGMQYWLEEVRAWNVHELFMVPAQGALLAGLLEGEDPAGLPLRDVFIGAAELSGNTVRSFTRLGISCLNNYGSSEGGAIAHPAFADGKYAVRPGAVGMLRPYMEYRFDHPDPEGYGELLIKGPSVSPGYLDEDGRFLPSLEDGWLATGDVARADADGFLYLKGRVKNLIILESGENVSPEELEEQFMRTNILQECQVFEYRNSLCMWVVPKSEAGSDGTAAAGTAAAGTAAVGAADALLPEGSPVEDYTRLAEVLSRVNAGLPSWKRISAFYLCEKLKRTSVGKVRRDTTFHPYEADRLRTGFHPDEADRLRTGKDTDTDSDGPSHISAEEAVLGAFAGAFARNDIGPKDDFFALGGDSLSGMAIVSVLLGMGYRVGIRDLFDHPVCIELADLLRDRMKEGPAGSGEKAAGTTAEAGETYVSPGIDPDTIRRLRQRFGEDALEAVYPAKGMDYEDLIRDKSRQYVLDGYFLDRLFILKHPMDRETFFSRVRLAARRHPVLRSKWVQDNKRWIQAVLKTAEIPAFYEDRSAVQGSAAEKLRLLMDEYRRRYTARKMEELPVPLCVRYYRLTKDRSVLLVELTHLYTDRFSEELLMSELLGHGEDVRDRFHDYQLAMRDLESGDHTEAAEFWENFRKKVEERKIRPLSSAYDTNTWKTLRFQDRYLLRMGKELSAAVREYAARARATPSELISFVYYRCLMDLHGMDALLFREVLTGRENLPFDPNGTYGYLVVIPPCYLEKKDTLRDYRERLAAVARHADIPLAYLWEQWKDVPYLMNKPLFRQSYLEETVSASSHLVSNPVWYKGSDIEIAYLFYGMGEYRLEILHADSTAAMRKTEELSQMFRKEMEFLTAKQV